MSEPVSDDIVTSHAAARLSRRRTAATVADVGRLAAQVAALGQRDDAGPYRTRDRATIDEEPPPAIDWRLVVRRLLGRPFSRTRDLDESVLHYRLAHALHVYEQRRAVVWLLVLVLLALVVVVAARRVSDGSAGVVIGTPPPPDYGRETMDARAALNRSELLVVYDLPGAPPTNKTLVLVKSSPIGSGKLNESETRAIQYARTALIDLLDKNSAVSLPCACAPMVGIARRLLVRHPSLDGDGAHDLVLYNVEIKSVGAELRVLRHSQAAFFNVPDESRVLADGNTSDVLIVRSKDIDVEYTHWPDPERVVNAFVGTEAYCIQECVDLMDGVSIWTRAIEQAARGIDVNRPWLGQLLARFGPSQ